MKLALFGATGRTGRELLRQALAAGHEVKALARGSARLGQAEGLEVLLGDATDAEAVARTVAGAEVVLSALGHAKGSPKDVQTTATRHIVRAIQENGVSRLISLTGAGVSDPNDQPKPADRVFGLLLKVVAGDVLRDAQAHAEVIRQSGVAYVIVRAPRLTNGPLTGRYRVTYVGKDSSTQVSRADVAAFMLSQLGETTWLGKAPMVSAS